MTIYVVIVSEGEYSDREESVVCAFEDKAAAEAYVLERSAKSREEYAAYAAKVKAQNGYTPYHSTSFRAEECELYVKGEDP